ncbi:PREDICTED: putative FBD-associated F-box protein At5g56440 [Camelina sativa]|uniref:FBD-associated F-box protein At5g56440 n=1 Tax=Camelina sativa TaxID=90675 RepID=A0ABM0WVB1_CAMSA|nr:PREDICTED: putative FBD-associated F-box protein At5g56440 [Camelina sativa]
MDRISLLSDEVILKILSFVPTKVAVTTSLLSKRWRYLWNHVPKLEYCDPSNDSEHWRASRFVDKFLLFHEAPVLETLHLTLSRNCPPIDIETWIRIAISRGVRDLKITRYFHGSGSGTIYPVLNPVPFPRSLYTCETLVTLNLEADFTVNDVPLTICFRSLKKLILLLVKLSSDDPVHRILSGCPVLEDLRLVRGNNDYVKSFTIAVPSLQRLIVVDGGVQVPGDDDVGFVIKVPSLKSLFVLSRCRGFGSLVKMPDLVKAEIMLNHGDSNKFMGCLTSTKQLFLCLRPPMDSCPLGVFNQLVSLNLCACSLVWCRLILNHTPKLRVLGFGIKQAKLFSSKNFQGCCISSVDVPTQWEQPSSVPQCLISSLETVSWIDYKGTQAEKKVVMYLLENSGQLKKMAISSLKSLNSEEKLKMLQELSSTQRSSTKCRLSFT